MKSTRSGALLGRPFRSARAQLELCSQPSMVSIEQFQGRAMAMARLAAQIACLSSLMCMITLRCSLMLIAASSSARVRCLVLSEAEPMFEEENIFRERFVEAILGISVQSRLVTQPPRLIVAMS